LAYPVLTRKTFYSLSPASPLPNSGYRLPKQIRRLSTLQPAGRRLYLLSVLMPTPPLFSFSPPLKIWAVVLQSIVFMTVGKCCAPESIFYLQTSLPLSFSQMLVLSLNDASPPIPCFRPQSLSLMTSLILFCEVHPMSANFSFGYLSFLKGSCFTSEGEPDFFCPRTYFNLTANLGFLFYYLENPPKKGYPPVFQSHNLGCFFPFHSHPRSARCGFGKPCPILSRTWPFCDFRILGLCRGQRLPDEERMRGNLSPCSHHPPFSAPALI